MCRINGSVFVNNPFMRNLLYRFRKKFGIEKSIGIGKKLVSKKVTDSVSKKVSGSVSFRFWVSSHFGKLFNIFENDISLLTLWAC